ncbi:MAG: hypothetical protein CGU28_12230 [Candidatus Dactylopiibacterium carminicum]|uniref:Sulfurtransferase TusA family protein n=1 Tax=Candidatus Dactylopiibacterium carminicum TaxID=857335 RepID=A0A272EPV5_9RHOO|nr:sulfurtransferase TusA family protein [Candidatus Dactylopiibacterium carminicum]KAF7598408.1 sulfurtransferase TusA family protein [Candidatus Dactylopiibacterium carminicum]PAS92155.1 MAG: hypothetical protein CGU29_12900 [Candidatus Dactylopiibacterium carminicum]PAS95583.1 MAG: hypothetical protein CGU28_12230 [Candidatus Dactylopiibacterium carminicum]PAS97573.1 MAG: hypothetical protein BSR46_13555 [Candidatus Dactylopiibacterium carminicum]
MELDARGLKCPLPILRTKKALASMQSGGQLRVLADDPAAQKDIEAFCRQTGHELLEVQDGPGEGVQTFVLRCR